jgi:hypothetical protein
VDIPWTSKMTNVGPLEYHLHVENPWSEKTSSQAKASPTIQSNAWTRRK